MIGPGTARVRLRVVGYGPARDESAESTSGAAFAVQAGAFAARDNAEALRSNLERRYSPVRVIEKEGSRTPWRVLVGEKRTEEEARSLAEDLRVSSGIEAFIVRLDEKGNDEK
jgi:cell division septation protein DedD